MSVFLLVAVRYLYFGFRYFPQLDDYIQYHNYARRGSVFYLIEKLGHKWSDPDSVCPDLLKEDLHK